MKGLTPEQLVAITAFIQEHHNFGWVKEENQIKGNLGYCIKYIDACYDSRQGDYWVVSFRGAGKITFSTNSFLFGEKPSDFTYTSLYEWIMAFLNYDWAPDEKRYNFMWNEKEAPLHNSFPNGIIEREWSDMDMMNAYCADLEDGTTSEDMADACKWVIQYRDKVSKRTAQSDVDERSVATEA